MFLLYPLPKGGVSMTVFVARDLAAVLLGSGWLVV